MYEYKWGAEVLLGGKNQAFDSACAARFPAGACGTSDSSGLLTCVVDSLRINSTPRAGETPGVLLEGEAPPAVLTGGV